jgi:hypothetical protein
MRAVRAMSVQAASTVLKTAPFISHLGVKLHSVQKGAVETTLEVQPWQKQVSGRRKTLNTTLRMNYMC